MFEIKDLCRAYLEGYIQAKVTEVLIPGKVLSSDLDKVKDMAVKCMEEYISHQNLNDKEKEKMKEYHRLWADMTRRKLRNDCLTVIKSKNKESFTRYNI